MRAAGKVWVVTGAASGIGREVALELLRRGARVAAVDVRADALGETASLAGAGARLSSHVTDITDRGATEALLLEVLAAHGAVDGIINNAGIIQPFVPFSDLGYDAITRVLDVNLRGTIHVTQAFLPHLLERPEAHVVNVSSMGGVFPFPGQTVYGASKAAVKLLTEGLYAELLDTPVAVSVVIPGPVATDIAANSGVDAPGGGQATGSSRIPMTPADEAARMLVDGVEKRRLHIYLGGVARLTSVAIRLAPRSAIRFVRTRMDRLLAGNEEEAPASGR